MITMAVVALLGVLALAGIYGFFSTRRGQRLAEVRGEIEREVGCILRRDQELELAFADGLEDGMPLEEALRGYRSGRSALAPARDKTADASSWDCDDLVNWKNVELHRRGEEVNRQLLVPALGSLLLVIAITVAAVAVLYPFSASRPNNTSTPVGPGAITAPSPLPLDPTAPGSVLPPPGTDTAPPPSTNDPILSQPPVRLAPPTAPGTHEKNDETIQRKDKT